MSWLRPGPAEARIGATLATAKSNMTCGSHIIGEIIGDLLEHIPR
jgi:hypothetical protein